MTASNTVIVANRIVFIFHLLKRWTRRISLWLGDGLLNCGFQFGNAKDHPVGDKQNRRAVHPVFLPIGEVLFDGCSRSPACYAIFKLIHIQANRYCVLEIHCALPGRKLPADLSLPDRLPNDKAHLPLWSAAEERSGAAPCWKAKSNHPIYLPRVLSICKR